MSAIFDFSSLLTVLLLLICTCAYLRDLRPTMFDGGQTLQPGETRLKRTGVLGFFWKMSRIGERLSPYVGASCVVMAINLLFLK
mmetsp:Transcript_10703/g.22693  ORF Transcript_10703/g.22693 Transcript_10703/m.22693 type:complete len:84 (-) Transcript_10703:370-621(-)